MSDYESSPSSSSSSSGSDSEPGAPKRSKLDNDRRRGKMVSVVASSVVTSSGERSRAERTRRDSREGSGGRSRPDDKENKRERLRKVGPEKKPDDNISGVAEGGGGSTNSSHKTVAGATNITNRTGGAYIPPAKLRMMQKEITDKSSDAYQRLSWDLLKKSIHGLVNKVNAANITQVVQQLFAENLIRGRGLFAKSILQAQEFSPTFTPVYAALIAIVNTKFPQIGELILRRLVLNFRKSFRRNLKQQCLTSTKLLAHLVNQSVAHEVLVLEILLLLLKDPPTDAGVELAVALVKEVGQKLTEVSPRGMNSIFERLRQILHEGGAVSERVQYMIELVHAVRKDGFKSYPSVPTPTTAASASPASSGTSRGGGGIQRQNSSRDAKMDPSRDADTSSSAPVVTHSLDLVCEGDQITHLLRLDEVEASHGQETLNVYKFDASYLENETKYEKIKRSILGDDDDEESGSGEGDSEDDGDSGAESDNDAGGETGIESSTSTQRIVDKTETNLMGLRRTIYLTIQSSLGFEECAHKLLKMDIKDDQVLELCQMVVDCCAQQRSYEKFFGNLAARFCLLRKDYMQAFEVIFKQQYETIHRLDSNKLRNTAKLFGHLLYSDALPWTVLECVHLNEEETTSSSRIFLKYLFQELAHDMGMPKLHARLNDPTLAIYFEGLLPRDNPKHTRFAINMFTSIGLGALTQELRDHIASVSSVNQLNGAGGPKVALPQSQGLDSSSSNESSSDDSSDTSDSSSSSSSSENGGKSKVSSSKDKEKEREDKKYKEKYNKYRGDVISNSLHTSPHKKLPSGGSDRDLDRDTKAHLLSGGGGHSISLDGTPSRQARGSRISRDSVLRRAAIEHNRRKNRSSSSSDENEDSKQDRSHHSSRRSSYRDSPLRVHKRNKSDKKQPSERSEHSHVSRRKDSSRSSAKVSQD